MMDKCLSVHVFNIITKDIPKDNYFICNIHPECILQADQTHCKECSKGECWNVVKLILILNKVINAIEGTLCFVNLGGRSAKQIGDTLSCSNICSADKILSDGFHLCTLGTYPANMNDQKLSCTQSVPNIDSFLNKDFGSRLHLTILDDCFEENKMLFAVKIDPATRKECDDNKKKRCSASRLYKNEKQHRGLANLTKE